MNILTQNPLVSIVIPCYNSEKFIVEAIESGLKQTYENIEVIVVNDGSTDNSLKEIIKYENKIKIISQVNKGGGAARNCGLKEASGDFIKFLDADDLLYENAIAEQVSSYQTFDNWDNLIVYGEVDVIDENNIIIKRDTQPRIDNDNQIAVLIRKNIITSAPLYQRAHLLEVEGFNESLKGNQEHDLNIRLALKGKFFKYFPTLIYKYRVHENEFRITRRNWIEKDPTFTINLLNYYEDLLKINNKYDSDIRLALANRHISAGRSLLRADKLKAAKKHFDKATELTNGYNFRVGNRSVAFTKFYMLFANIIGLQKTERLYYSLTNLTVFNQ